MFLESCLVVHSALEKNKVLVIEEKEDRCFSTMVRSS